MTDIWGWMDLMEHPAERVQQVTGDRLVFLECPESQVSVVLKETKEKQVFMDHKANRERMDSMD
jgi:hypothetical protein